VLAYYGAATRPAAAGARPRLHWVETTVAVTVALLVCAALASGRLQLSPATALPPGGTARDTQDRRVVFLQRTPGQHGSWQRGPRYGTFYVLTPFEGLLALALAGALIAGLPAAARVR